MALTQMYRDERMRRLTAERRSRMLESHVRGLEGMLSDEVRRREHAERMATHWHAQTLKARIDAVPKRAA